MSHQIMLVTGEASGDLHGANLVRALRVQNPALRFCGMGGPELAAVGVEILYDAAKVAVVGAVEVVAHLRDIWQAQRILRQRLDTDPPDLLILIDLPDFNLMLAKKAKSIGVPVYYYISPQIWAWRSGRVKVIRDRVDRIGVILPFEEDFYRRHGVSAQYVGHPLLDTVRTGVSRDSFLSSHQLPAGCRCIGLFPGSRRREIASLLPIFLAAANQLRQQSTEKLVFFLPRASTITTGDLCRAGLDDFRDTLDIRVIEHGRYDMMAACDAVVTASGTVTLELAILEVPMVVTYKLAPLSYFLAKRLIRVDYFSLVNLIAGYRAVPELLQHEVTPDRIAAELSALTTSVERKKQMQQALGEVRAKLGESGASARAASVALELLHAAKKPPVVADQDMTVALPIDGILDLHAFSPKDLATLIPDYLAECQTRNIVEVRLIHGKGRGQLRRSVQSLLARNPQVESFRQADPSAGGWGATIVRLKAKARG